MYNHNFQQLSSYSDKIDHVDEISMEELQQQMSQCFAQNCRLRQIIKNIKSQQQNTKKEYDAMFRQLQIEQCRLNLTIEEQNNQIRKMSKQVSYKAHQSTKGLKRDHDMALLQQQIQTLTTSLNRIKDSKQESSSLHEEINILKKSIGQLKLQISIHKQSQLRLKSKIIQLQNEIKVKNEKIYILESNEQNMRETYEFQINLLQKQHEEIIKMIEPSKQEIYTTQNIQTQRELEIMIHKVRESNKQLVHELDLKANQTDRLIEQIESLKEAEIDLKEMHNKEKIEISQNLDLLMKGFNEQIVNYQNKMLFMLEYIEEVENGKAQKVEQMRQNYSKLKKSLSILVKHVIKI